MSVKQKVGQGAIAIGAITLFVLIVGYMGLFQKNDDQNFQIHQSLTGKITVVDHAGFYAKWFGTVWTYPRIQEAYFSASTKEGGDEDDSIRVTFNDGGMAQISTLIRYKLPSDMDKRRELHRNFSGNPDNIKTAIRSALINCCKNSAPLMSASENQSARKSEFAQLVEEQLRNGVYEMRRIAKKSFDEFDKTGEPITIYVTQVVTDEKGNPVIAQSSPLKEYGIEILQFSVTGTDYDAATRKQFAAKKDAFLKAELSKSQKEEEVQKRLQVVEKGLREKAEMESKMNVEKAESVIRAEKEKQMAEIEAQQKVAVEEQSKLEAEARLSKELAIAMKTKEIAETKANQQLEVAKIEQEQAIAQAEAMVSLAKAKEEQIKRSGAITEQERVQLEIKKETDIGVAKALADGLGRATLPKTVIIGGGEKGSIDPMSSLMQLLLLKMVGKEAVVAPRPQPRSK